MSSSPRGILLVAALALAACAKAAPDRSTTTATPNGESPAPVATAAPACDCPPGDPVCGCVDDSPIKAATVEATGLPREEVMKVITAHEREAQACFDEARKAEPSLEGKLSMRFTIGPSGDVTDASVGSTTFATPDVGACVTRAIRRWKFPSPGHEPQRVEYPYAFEAKR